MTVERLRSMISGDSPASAVIDLLVASQPLTAKQIYYKLKKHRALSISYQAVHKILQTLLRDGLIEKEGLEYVVSVVWFEKAEQLARDIRKNLRDRNRNLARLARSSARHGGVKIISFDLDGTLFDNHYDELLWRTEFPRRYARKYGISLEAAFERVTAEYRRLWGKTANWRDPLFWISHFNLDCDFADLTRGIQKHIKPYNDALPVVKKLSERYRLVIITHAQHALVDQKLRRARIRNLFTKVYSAGEDFGKLTKDVEMFQAICSDLGVAPEELLHIGDKHDLDHLMATDAGVRALLLDRAGHKKDAFVIRDLHELEDKLLELMNS